MKRADIRRNSVALRRLALATWAAVALGLGIAEGAHASCALQGPPSPNVFTGTVVATRSNGRIATVRTVDGRTVVVRGTTVDSDTTATSVDRNYRVGGRYEFHPYNAASPFGDDACTQTRLLSIEPIHDQTTVRRAVLSVGVAIGGSLVVFLCRRSRRRRGPRTSVR